MQCETCGKDVKSGKRVKLEGSVIFTCDDCARYGQIIGEVSRTDAPVKKQSIQPKPQSYARRPSVEEEVETLVEDFHTKIKNAREKMGLKQEELAKKLNEPVSLVHRLETEAHYEPSDDLIRRLQKTLGVKLLEKTKAVDLDSLKTGSRSPKDLTLGDVVVVKKRK